MENILFIDDDLSILKTLKMIMQKEGYKLHFANTVASARQILKRHKIAVIFADKNLPNGSGIDILAEAQDISPRSIRVVLSGDYDLSSTQESIKKANIYCYMTKPFNGKAIKETITRALNSLNKGEVAKNKLSNSYLHFKKLSLTSSQLSPGMKLLNNLSSDSGVFLAPKGHILSFKDLKAVANYKITPKIPVLSPS